MAHPAGVAHHAIALREEGKLPHPVLLGGMQIEDRVPVRPSEAVEEAVDVWGIRPDRVAVGPKDLEPTLGSERGPGLLSAPDPMRLPALLDDQRPLGPGRVQPVILYTAGEYRRVDPGLVRQDAPAVPGHGRDPMCGARTRPPNLRDAHPVDRRVDHRRHRRPPARRP